MASRIPKGKFDVLAVNINVGNVVLENGRDVDLQGERSARAVGGKRGWKRWPEIKVLERRESEPMDWATHLREGALGENTVGRFWSESQTSKKESRGCGVGGF